MTSLGNEGGDYHMIGKLVIEMQVSADGWITSVSVWDSLCLGLCGCRDVLGDIDGAVCALV